MKDFQATGEAFSPLKRTSSLSKHEIYSLFRNSESVSTNPIESGSETLVLTPGSGSG
jgi:hypothetical protein